MSNEKRTQIMTKSFLPSWSYVDVVSVRKKWYKMQGVVTIFVALDMNTKKRNALGANNLKMGKCLIVSDNNNESTESKRVQSKKKLL